MFTVVVKKNGKAFLAVVGRQRQLLHLPVLQDSHRSPRQRHLEGSIFSSASISSAHLFDEFIYFLRCSPDILVRTCHYADFFRVDRQCVLQFAMDPLFMSNFPLAVSERCYFVVLVTTNFGIENCQESKKEKKVVFGMLYDTRFRVNLLLRC